MLTDVSAMCEIRREVVREHHRELRAELFAKICRAELVALEVTFDEKLIKIILLYLVFWVSQREGGRVVMALRLGKCRALSSQLDP